MINPKCWLEIKGNKHNKTQNKKEQQRPKKDGIISRGSWPVALTSPQAADWVGTWPGPRLAPAGAASVVMMGTQVLVPEQPIEDGTLPGSTPGVSSESQVGRGGGLWAEGIEMWPLLGKAE